MNRKLVFVYNADSGVFNTLFDIAHKIFSPETYECKLCELTHSLFSMRDEWKESIASLDTECEFLHRDEFIQRYGDRQGSYPAVYLDTGEDIRQCLGAEQINGCDDMKQLKVLISQHC